MLPSRRKFKRFDLFLDVEFRPTFGNSGYNCGTTRNFSCTGLGLESSDIDFDGSKNLELNLKFPGTGTLISLLGDIVWKKQASDKKLAGIKFRMMNHKILNDLLEEISSHGNISVKDILYINDAGYIVKESAEEKPASILSSEQNNNSSSQIPKSGLVKEYLDNGECKVTFLLPEKAAPDAQSVTLVGDFNDWNSDTTPMMRLESGDFLVTLNLPCNGEYRFRYLIDGNRWENDWNADKYVPNAFGSDDSVVVL
jgi:hypothetical protein